MSDLDSQLRAQAEAEGVDKLVVGALCHHDGRILVLRRTSDDFMGDIEELPSGGVHANETLFVALARELAEETGLDLPAPAENGFRGSFDYTSGSGRATRQYTFAVPFLEPVDDIRLSDEHTSYRWLDRDYLATSDLTPQTQRVIHDWLSFMQHASR